MLICIFKENFFGVQGWVLLSLVRTRSSARGFNPCAAYVSAPVRRAARGSSENKDLRLVTEFTHSHRTTFYCYPIRTGGFLGSLVNHPGSYITAAPPTSPAACSLTPDVTLVHKNPHFWYCCLLLIGAEAVLRFIRWWKASLSVVGAKLCKLKAI